MSKTSLNGYSYGKNPTTDAPFWGEGGGGGAVINDETTALDSTWSSSKISSELATKANATDVYTKTEVDESLAYKADSDDVYDKTSVDMKLADKADKSDTYTKTQVDTELAGKADASTTYTKTEMNTRLGQKADWSEVYRKSQVDTALDAKADASTTYTKTEVNTALADKADKSDTYTKTQVDNLIAGAGGASIDDTTTSTTSVWSSKKTSDELATKADASTTYTKTEVNTALADKADKSDTYTKTQVDNLIAGAGGASIDDTTTSASSVWSSQKVSTELATKADTSTVVAWDDLRTYYANRLSTRYTANYGATTAFEDGKNYSSVGTINISIGGGVVYNDQLIDIPYNNMQSSGTQYAIGDVGKYRWKDTYLFQNNYIDAGNNDYYLLPVKMAFIGYQSSNGKYNPYLYILREKKLPREGHSSQSNEITVSSYITDWTEVTSGGGGGSAIPTSYASTHSSITIEPTDNDVRGFEYGDVADINLSITINGKANLCQALIRNIGNQYMQYNSPPQEFTPVVLTDPACTVYVAANTWGISPDTGRFIVDLYLYYPSDYAVTAFTGSKAYHREFGLQRIKEGVSTVPCHDATLSSLTTGHKAAVALSVKFESSGPTYKYYALLDSPADNHVVNGHYFGNFVSCEAETPKQTISGAQVQSSYNAPDIKVALFEENGQYYYGFILPHNLLYVDSCTPTVIQTF